MIRSVWFVVGAALALGMPGIAPARNAVPDRHSAVLVSALDAVNSGHPDRALDLVAPVLADYERQYASATQTIYCGMTPTETLAYMAMAAAAKHDAIAVDANYCIAQYVRAYALVDLRRIDEALDAYRRLVTFAPMHARYLNELAYVLQQKRDFAASVAIYRQAADAAGAGEGDAVVRERCLALRGIGYDLTEMGQLDAAAASYRKCLEIQPDDPKSLGELEYIKRQRHNTT